MPGRLVRLCQNDSVVVVVVVEGGFATNVFCDLFVMLEISLSDQPPRAFIDLCF